MREPKAEAAGAHSHLRGGKTLGTMTLERGAAFSGRTSHPASHRPWPNKIKKALLNCYRYLDGSVKLGYIVHHLPDRGELRTLEWNA